MGGEIILQGGVHIAATVESANSIPLPPALGRRSMCRRFGQPRVKFVVELVTARPSVRNYAYVVREALIRSVDANGCVIVVKGLRIRLRAASLASFTYSWYLRCGPCSSFRVSAHASSLVFCAETLPDTQT